jgi:aminoglycoside phosphotransferase (APT) family kinase protein
MFPRRSGGVSPKNIQVGATSAPVMSKGRDMDTARQTLEPWLAAKLGRKVAITDFSFPAGAGISNETILLTLGYDGPAADDPPSLALRIRPSTHYQLFLDPEFEMQYQLFEALHRSGLVKVAKPYWYEADATLLGQPFFVMERLHGQVPVSIPVYNSTGWLYDATPAQRRIVWETAVTEFARIHTVPVDLVRFVDRPQWGPSGVAQQLDYWRRCLEWALPGRVAPIMWTIFEWLSTHIPDVLEDGLSWGDARMGNMMFGDDFRLVGVNDWEQASLSGANQDMGWWLFFDDYHSIDHGLARLDGLGNRQETIDLWQSVTGKQIHDLHFYEVFSGFKLSTLVFRTLELGSIAGKLIARPRLLFLERTCALLGLDVPAEFLP